MPPQKKDGTFLFHDVTRMCAQIYCFSKILRNVGPEESEEGLKGPKVFLAQNQCAEDCS